MLHLLWAKCGVYSCSVSISILCASWGLSKLHSPGNCSVSESVLANRWQKLSFPVPPGQSERLADQVPRYQFHLHRFWVGCQSLCVSFYCCKMGIWCSSLSQNTCMIITDLWTTFQQPLDGEAKYVNGLLINTCTRWNLSASVPSWLGPNRYILLGSCLLPRFLYSWGLQK